MWLTRKTLLMQQRTTSCHASLQVDGTTSCKHFRTGIYLFSIFLQRGSKHLLRRTTMSSCPFMLRSVRRKSQNISRYQRSQRFCASMFFGAKCGIWQTFLPGLQLLSCRVSCRRFDRFHFTLSHWQRCYKQVQITTEYMKVKKKSSRGTVEGLRYWN